MDSHAEEVAPVDHLAERRSLADTPMNKFFEAAIRFEGSDVILRGGQAPKLRLRGSLRSLDVPVIDPVEFEKWIEDGVVLFSSLS